MLIVGSGIAGLAAALACQRAGWPVRVVDKVQALSPFGAGIQLGPNAVRLLDGWGLGNALRARAARPQQLQVRSAARGTELANLPLGDACVQRYGSDYLTLHRADLQALLLQAAGALGVQPELDVAITSIAASAHSIRAEGSNGFNLQAPAVLAADGLWSATRAAVPAATQPRFTGHWAWRALLPRPQWPVGLAADRISVWLGDGLHAVGYPVNEAAYNLVVLVQTSAHNAPAPSQHWNHEADAQTLLRQVGPAHNSLLTLLHAAPAWKRWALYDQPPLIEGAQMAHGRAALLGDAAHAMLPYLAQGAAMALEDAHALQQSLQAIAPGNTAQIPAALQTYAQARWQRCAQVQARAQRNGRIFHLRGPMQWGRDAALQVLGARLLDMPWLYASR